MDISKFDATADDEGDLEANPKAMNVVFKDKFIERYQKLTDWEAFKTTSLSYIRKAIRVNTLKTNVPEVKKRLSKWELKQVPWCKEGFWIKGERFDIGNLLEHVLGHIYVQEASSMIPATILDPRPGEKILDMCASPGSKSTQIAQYMKNEGLLVCNDISQSRLKILGANLQRMGVHNSIITMNRRFEGFEFDKILVDAPCSGTGTIMKSLRTIQMWNPGGIKNLSNTQKALLDSAFRNVKNGGIIVYSTCTMEPEEDEEVIDTLLKKYGNAVLEDIEFNGKRSQPVLEFEGKKYDERIKKCLRIWPQDNNTEGFFVAKIRKG